MKWLTIILGIIWFSLSLRFAYVKGYEKGFPDGRADYRHQMFQSLNRITYHDSPTVHIMADEKSGKFWISYFCDGKIETEEFKHFDGLEEPEKEVL